MELLAFWILAVLALLSAAVVVFHRNPVVCALALALNLASIAGFYMLLNAQFLALMQLIVYAGAIMVLILFVVMLLNLPDDKKLKRGKGFIQRWLGIALAVVFAFVLGRGLYRATGGAEFMRPSADFGTVEALGMELFSRFFYVFEAISLLLIVAMVGAVLLAKRRL